MKLKTRYLISASVVLGGLAVGLPAAAQATGTSVLEEVVVTAEYRTQDLQQMAASASVRSGTQLLTQGRYQLSQIIEDIPGVTGGAAQGVAGTGNSPTGTDSPQSGLTFRGIPSNAGIGITSVATSAAVYVDDVYGGLGGSYGLDRVEALRGPQGTLYGRSATSGVLAIHTSDPNLSKLDASGSVELGNFALQHYTGALNIPLVADKLAVMVSGNRYSRDGYYSKQGTALVNRDGRIKLLYRPADNLSFLLGYAFENNIAHGGGISLTEVSPGQITISPTTIGSGKNNAYQYWGNFGWSFAGVKLTYIPAYRTWDSSATNFVQVPAVGLNATQYLQTPTDTFWTHELRLASDTPGKLSWQVGALYYQNKLANSSRTVDGVSAALYFNSVVAKTTTAIGGFGEATYAFTDDWRFTGGLRYDYTDVQATNIYTSNLNLGGGGPKGTATYSLPENNVSVTLSGAAGERTFNNLTYKARLEHDLTPQNMVYLLTSTGFTPGDVAMTTGSDGAPTTVVFNAETLTSYEVGSKNRFLDSRLQVNAAAFYYNYGGYQVANINISLIPGVTAFTNVSAPARAYGGEAEFLYRFTADDRVSLNLAYTNAYFVDQASQIVPGTGGKTFAYYFARSRIPGSIPLTASLTYDHTMHLPGGSTLVLHGDTRYLSAHDEGRITTTQLALGAGPYVHIGGQVIGNINATWTSPGNQFSVTGYVRNVGDNQYLQTIGVSDTLPGQFGASPGNRYDPRTYGVVVSARF